MKALRLICTACSLGVAIGFRFPMLSTTKLSSMITLRETKMSMSPLPGVKQNYRNLLIRGKYLQNGEDVLAYDILPGAGEDAEKAAVLYLPAFDTIKESAKGGVVLDCAASLGRTYVQMDWYGVGRSSGDFTHKGTITRWTEDALKVIREVIPTQQVIIVGGGVGAWIGLIIAKKYPDLVAGIIGLAADPDFTENLLWRFLPEGKKKEITDKEFVSLYWGGQGYCISKALIEDGRNNLLLEGAPGQLDINCPIRLIHGTMDREVPIDVPLRLSRRVKSKDLRITLISRADHNLEGLASEKCISQIGTEFIAECIGVPFERKPLDSPPVIEDWVGGE